MTRRKRSKLTSVERDAELRAQIRAIIRGNAGPLALPVRFEKKSAATIKG